MTFLDMDDYTATGELPLSIDSAITLPPPLFKLVEDKDNVSIFFVHYNTSTLFPVGSSNETSENSSTKAEVGSTILAATVGRDITFQNLQQEDANVTIFFRLDEPQNKV